MRFFPSVAAAQSAGFHACKRCRPDASPGSPEWNTRADVVARAMRLIADGVIEREGVNGLARHLGYSTRQIERHLQAELGAGPLALARAQRAQTARILIETTTLPMIDVSDGAGFLSIRSFNDTIRDVFDITPTQMRTRAHKHAETSPPGELALRLAFRKPFDPSNVFGHLAATGIPGVEEWRDGWYRRTLTLAHGNGIVALQPGENFVSCKLRLDDLRDLTTAIARCRHLLDLDADPETIDEHLKTDPHLRSLVAKSPGRRVPHSVDAKEFAIRAVLGQQVSTAAARTHAKRLVLSHGEAIDDPDGGLTHTFPTVEALSELNPEDLKFPQKRRQTLLAMIDALRTQKVVLEAGVDWRAARAELDALPGVGPWTIESIAMRALGDPNAFLASDLGVIKAAAALRLPTKPRQLETASHAWAPWRAYAVQHLWTVTEHAVNTLPERNSA